MIPKLKYTLLGQSGFARAGFFELNGVKVQTPCFMPVGTKGSVKGLPLGLLNEADYMGEDLETNIILANTMHLYLRPGDQVIKDHG